MNTHGCYNSLRRSLRLSTTWETDTKMVRFNNNSRVIFFFLHSSIIIPPIHPSPSFFLINTFYFCFLLLLQLRLDLLFCFLATSEKQFPATSDVRCLLPWCTQTSHIELIWYKYYTYICYIKSDETWSNIKLTNICYIKSDETCKII